MTKTKNLDTMSAPREGSGGERSDSGGSAAKAMRKWERSDLPLSPPVIVGKWNQLSFGDYLSGRCSLLRDLAQWWER